MNLVLVSLQRLAQIGLVFLVGLVAALLIALFSTRQLVNEQLRTQIAAHATEASGLAITVGEVRGDWWAGLTLRDVKIHETERPESGVLVAVPVVQVDYTLLSFFGSRPRAIRLDAYHPAATVRVGRDHQLKFKPKARPPAPLEQPLPPVDIVVHAGHLAYIDDGARKPFTAEVTNLSGQGRLRGFALAMDLQALRDNDPIRAHVDYSLKDLAGQVRARATGLSAPYFVNRFGYAPEYEMTAGRADADITVAWRDPVTPKMDTVSLGGTLTLSGGEARLKNVAVPVTDLRADVSLHGDEARLVRAEGRLAGMPLEATGVIDRVLETQPKLMMPDPVLKLSVVAPQVALAQLSLPFPGIKNLGLAGEGVIHAKVTGTSSDPRVAMRGFVPSGFYGREPVRDFYIAADYRTGQLDIPAWRLKVAGGAGAGTAYVGLPADPKALVPYRVGGRFSGLDARALIARHAAEPKQLPLSGRLGLGFAVSGVGARAQTRADLALTEGRLAGRPVTQLAATYHYQTPRWEVPKLTLRWGGTAIDAQLTGSDAGDFALTARVPHAELAELAKLSPTPLKLSVAGRLTADVRVQGLSAKPETWRGAGKLALAGARVDQLALPSAGVAFTLQDNRLRLADGAARLLGGQLAFSGDFAPAIAPDMRALKGTLALTASRLDVARLPHLPPELKPIQATAGGRLSVHVADGGWRATGAAEATRVRHPAWGRLDGLSATLAADPKHLHLLPLTWRQGAERVTATGTIGLGDRPTLAMRVQAERAEVATLLGAVDWPRVVQTLNPKAAEVAAATGPRRDRAALPGRDDVLTPIMAELPTRMRADLEHWLAWRKAPLNRPAPAPAVLPFWEDAKGKLSLDALLIGPLDRLSVNVHARVSDLAVFRRHLDEAELSLGWANERLTLSRLRLREDGRTVLTGGGALSDRPGDSLVLQSHDMDLAWSRRALSPHRMRLDGRGTVSLRLRGPWASPRLEADGVLHRGTFSGPDLEAVAFEQIQARLAYEKGRLLIDRASLREGGHEATVSGTWPLNGGTAGAGGDMDLSVKLADGNLAIVNLFSQGQFHWLGGKGLVELRLGGTPLKPTLSGQIQLHEGRLSAKGLDSPVENLHADIVLSDDRVQVNALEGRYGGGDVTLQGDVTMDQFKPERFNLTAKARPFRLQLTNDYYQGMVEADLRLTGPVAQPQLSGMVALRDGLLRLKDDAKKDAPPKEPNPLRLENLQIALGPNLRIKNALIDVLVTTQQRQGFLQVDGPIANPKPSGVVIIESGTIRPLNNTFNITEGRVEFFGEQVRTDDELLAILAPDAGGDPTANLNAKLDITARTTIYDYKESEPIDIQARVTGSLQQMDMRFSSEPIRSQQELLDMLSKKQVLAQTFNGKLDGGEVIVKEVGGLVTSNIEELISPYTLYLRNALSLQTFRVELVPDYEKDSINNVAGFKPALTLETRPLLDRISVGSRLVVGSLYDTSPTTLGDHTYFGLNWRLARNFAVQYRVDPYVDQTNQRLLNQTLGLKAQFSY